MKKVLLLIAVICLIFSGVSYAALTCDAVTATGNCKSLNTGGVSYAGTCQVSGASITSFNIDIDGSTDGVTWYGLFDNITAIGNYSFVAMPFALIRADVDAMDATSLTVDCIWLPAH